MDHGGTKEEMSGLVIFLYLAGAFIMWINCSHEETIASIIVGEPVQIVPWKKSVAAAAWPLSALYIAYVYIFGRGNSSE